MISYPSLNRRHKVGLFLVLVAAGISLFFEDSAKQTAGIVLLGLAATWLLGSLSVRALRLLSSVMACGVGIFLAGKPVLDDWKSFHESVQNYERAMSDLRQAVTLAKKWTPIDYDALAKQAGAISSSPPAIDWSNYDGSRPVFDYDPLTKKWVLRKLVTITPDAPPARTKPTGQTKGHSEAKVQGQGQTKGKQRTQGQYTVADIDSGLPPLPAGYTLDMTVEIPASTVGWERTDLGLLPTGATVESGSLGTRLSFPSKVDEEELISTIQNQLLQPRPKFSFRASLISNPLSSAIGLAFLTAGLFSLGWFVRSGIRVKGGNATV